MKKRIASLLMAVVMTATLGIGAMAATTEQVLVQGNKTGLSAANFKDLADNSKPDGRHWAWDSIDHVVKYGLFNGTSATTFAPQNPMTRAQFVVVVTRLENASRTASNKLNVERVPTETRFTDVPTDMWCAGAVAWAEANGIVEGYSDNTFRPNQAISRAQIAAFVYRYVNNYKKYNLKSVTPEPAQFTDFALASEVFHTAINYCRTHGLINGYSDHTLRPNISVTRAQVAAILSRIIIILETGRSGGGGGGGGGGTPSHILTVIVKSQNTQAGVVSNGGTLTVLNSAYTSANANTPGASFSVNDGTVLTFTVAPDTANGFRAIGPSITSGDNNDAVTFTTTAATATAPASYSFTMPAANTTIEVSFTNATLSATMNNALLGFYTDTTSGTLKDPSDGAGTYYLKIDSSFYKEGKDLLSFKMGTSSNENAYPNFTIPSNPGFTFTEVQALGLYGEKYNDGWYRFNWNGTDDLAFYIDTTDSADYYTYDISVAATPVGLKANTAGKTLTGNAASPHVGVINRPATETLLDSAKLLNDDMGGQQDNGKMIRSVMESVIYLVEGADFTLNKPALLNRVMKQAIESKIDADTFAQKMKDSLNASDANGWKNKVQDGIWNEFKKSSTYSQQVPVSATATKPMSALVDTTSPILIPDADNVVVSADPEMVRNVADTILSQVNDRMDDLTIGAKLTSVDAANVHGATNANTGTNQYVERYFQVTGTATNNNPASGENSKLLLLTPDPNLSVTVKLTRDGNKAWPHYYLHLTSEGQSVFNGDAGFPRDNRYTTVNGAPVLDMGSLEEMLSTYEETIKIGTQSSINVNLNEVGAGVPVRDIISKETIDNKVDNQKDKLGDNTKSTFESALYGNSGAFAAITETDTTAAYAFNVTLGGTTMVNVMPAYTNTARTTWEAVGKESVIHVVTNPDYWANDSTGSGTYFDRLVDIGQQLREAMKADKNNGINYYNRMGRGTFSSNTTQWKSGFDAAVRGYDVTGDATDTRYAFAEAAAKTDSTAADLWRTLGLSQPGSGNTMSYTYTKGIGNDDYGPMLDQLIGTHEATVTVTITRNHTP